MTISEHSFRAMGSTFRIRIDTWVNVNAPETASQVAELFQSLCTETEKIEQTLSRFRTDSELTQLNEDIGVPHKVSSCMEEVLELAQTMTMWTEGAFDPRILPGIEAIGYHGAAITSITPLAFKELPLINTPSGEDTSMGSWRLFESTDNGTVSLLAPIDLGGIGKGYTADVLARFIEEYFNTPTISGYIVDAGGDIVVGGCQHTGEPWTIGVENPLEPSTLAATLTPPFSWDRVAICTSSIWRNSWVKNGRHVHHLIDPITQQPADTNLLSVTAIAHTASLAETITKYVFLRGPEKSFLWEHAEPLFLAIDRDGQLFFTDELNPYISWMATSEVQS